MRLIPLLLSATGTVACFAQSPRPVQSASPMQSADAGARELLPNEQIQQVLNRLTFGARPGDAAAVRAMGVDNWIDLQLHPDRISDDGVEQLMRSYSVFSLPTSTIVGDYTEVQRLQRQAKQSNAKDSSMTPAETRRQLIADNPQVADAARVAQQLTGQVQSAALARAVTTNRQLDEVMVDFWENHFSVFAGKGQTRLFLPQYDQDVIRPYALGKFRDLLGAVAKSPAMLFFLDNWQSAADSTHPTLAERPGAGRRGG
ncbi:MAG TPA: DUF1800 family protein, partial [Gemmatimonadaceae bacterium]|nr:DUF1800 family protein [Gemmatimonadaceae bacterium]